MAKVVVNPSAELSPRGGDINLSLEQLGSLGVFATLKKAPAFAKFPGSQVLRRYRAGEAICHQGQPGTTAFYLLTDEDLAHLCQNAGNDDAWQGEMRTAQAQLSALQSQQSDEALRLGTARLMVSRPAISAGGSWWRSFWNAKPKDRSKIHAKPAFIPIDGPSDIEYDTREAPIYAGEVFGEMSCLTRQPRSATVVADTDCYALEFLRNILDQLRRDKTYKQQSEKKYRERVMEGHLRQLSVFKYLTGQQFRSIQDRVDLVDFEPGNVIWDEGDDADCIYVVRSGIVQVLQAYPWKLAREEIRDWEELTRRLTEDRESVAALEHLWNALSEPVQTALSASEKLSESLQRDLVDDLNALAKTNKLLTAKELGDDLKGDRFQKEVRNYPAKVKDWNGLQVRRSSRLVIDRLLGDCVEPVQPHGISRVLTYAGRGETLGEIGLALGQPRSASCVAYSHPDSDRESTEVELVRISAEVFQDIVAQSPQAKAEIQQLIKTRQERDAQRRTSAGDRLAESRRAESLGLMQGQKLMLIDLDRCTRCGDCVKACIDTHDDGHSRLYLDGPRFGKYLVPSSCRQCRDPVCMIGCPVGSIQQGEHGEIQITDWCIGCGVCARQCPYDSIQMHDESLIPAGSPGWRWAANERAADKWMKPGFSDGGWETAAAPHDWGIAMASNLLATGNGFAKTGPIHFRLRFQVAATEAEHYQLVVTSHGSNLHAYLNGLEVELAQDERQKKKGEYQAVLPARRLQRGEILLAVSVQPPEELGAKLLDARIDDLTAASEQVEEKMVTERAVVCDQCASLSGDRHACVYACPHEAALRIDAWEAFPTG